MPTLPNLFFKKIFLLMSMYLFESMLSVYESLQGPEEGIGSPGTGGTGVGNCLAGMLGTYLGLSGRAASTLSHQAI